MRIIGTGETDMSTALAIRDQVRALLSGGIDLDSFEDWFLSHTWNAHLHEDAPTVAAIHRIEGTLLDYSSRAIGLETLHKELAAAIGNLAVPQPQSQSVSVLDPSEQGRRITQSLHAAQSRQIFLRESPSTDAASLSLRFTAESRQVLLLERVASVA